MTSSEVWNLIRVVYGAYNQTAFDVDKKTLVESWSALLGEFTYPEAKKAAMEIASISKVMPTPGGIRRFIIGANVDDKPPTVQEAWAWLMSRNRDLAQGTWSQDSPHPVMVEAMKSLGAVISTLSTNGDREYFASVYNDKLLDYELNLYKVKE